MQVKGHVKKKTSVIALLEKRSTHLTHGFFLTEDKFTLKLHVIVTHF